jgi:hypothetical protein
MRKPDEGAGATTRAPSQVVEDDLTLSANGRGRAKTPRIFANNRAERNFSRFFRFQAV